MDPVAARTQPVVLVADDSATVRLVVRMELESAGYDVREAANGRIALDTTRAGGIDVILLDVEMPELDGFGTIAALKADAATADIPVIFLTGRADTADVVGALRLGAQDYLSKPPQPAELLARVGAALQVARLRQELRDRTEELDRVSRTDHLTGVYNRRHLDSQLHLLIATATRHHLRLTVLLVDIDHFKVINDSHGHLVGDAALQSVARRLHAALRTDDLVGRWGGEEFLVLAPHTNLDGAAILGDRLRAVVASSPHQTPAGLLDMTISVGSATSRDAAEGAGLADLLLRTADTSLYRAKADGRNRVVSCLVSARDAVTG